MSHFVVTILIKAVNIQWTLDHVKRQNQEEETDFCCRTSVVGSQDVAADLWTGPRSSLQSSLRRYSEPGRKNRKIYEI